MAKYRIAWLPGDGIGKEVMESARIVLDALKLDAEYVKGDVGWEFWKSEGNALPTRTVEMLKNTDCCLFGAITSKPKQEADKELNPELRGKGYVYYSPIVKLRQDFNLHTNIRPCKAYKGNPMRYKDNIDLVIFRENTEGLYSGVEFYPLPKDLMDELVKHPKMERFKQIPLEDIALSCRIITRKGARTVIGKAFEYAKKHSKSSVTLIEKPNVLRETSGLMTREARNLAKEYSGIKLWERNIDAMCQLLLVEPEKYSVLVASNLFGDIISDLAAQITGGLGFAASANIGDKYALFEPTHGSAPDIAGQHKANPIAMLLSVKLMLDYLGERELADRVENAISAVIEQGRVKTFDIGGTATTFRVTDEIVKRL